MKLWSTITAFSGAKSKGFLHLSSFNPGKTNPDSADVAAPYPTLPLYLRPQESDPLSHIHIPTHNLQRCEKMELEQLKVPLKMCPSTTNQMLTLYQKLGQRLKSLT